MRWGKKKFLEFLLFAAFILFFYGPMLNMLMLAFANEYQAPAILPQEWGFKWWEYVFSQDSLVSSIVQSFIVAIITTIVSMILCIPRHIRSRASNTAAASCLCCPSC